MAPSTSGTQGRSRRPHGLAGRSAGPPPSPRRPPSPSVRVERLERLVVGALRSLNGRVQRSSPWSRDDRDPPVDPAESAVRRSRPDWSGRRPVEENDGPRPSTDSASRPSGTIAGTLDGVPRGWEGAAHLIGIRGQVVIDDQQVGQDSLALEVPGTRPRRSSLAGPFACVRYSVFAHPVHPDCGRSLPPSRARLIPAAWPSGLLAPCQWPLWPVMRDASARSFPYGDRGLPVYYSHVHDL